MLNKEELQKIVVSSAEDLKPFAGKCIEGKYIYLKTVVKDVKPDVIRGCVIEGGGIACRRMEKCELSDMDYVFAEKMNLTVIKRCHRVEIGDVSEGYELTASQLFNCRVISVTDGIVRDCIFNDFETLYLTNVEAENCLVMNVVCDNDCAISTEDTSFSEFSFENIELRNESYLIDAYGDTSVENSVFKNIRTSREDYEIFNMEETEGIIFKRKKKYSFVDEDSCSGLNLIMDINGKIDMENFIDSLEEDE